MNNKVPNLCTIVQSYCFAVIDNYHCVNVGYANTVFVDDFLVQHHVKMVYDLILNDLNSSLLMFNYPTICIVDNLGSLLSLGDPQKNGLIEICKQEQNKNKNKRYYFLKKITNKITHQYKQSSVQFVVLFP